MAVVMNCGMVCNVGFAVNKNVGGDIHMFFLCILPAVEVVCRHFGNNLE